MTHRRHPPSGKKGHPSCRLVEIELPIDDELSIPEPIQSFLEDSRWLIQTFWDQWHRRPIEQYVACDFDYVWRSLQALKKLGTVPGTSFVEWGCGFGMVTGLGWLSGFSAVGIEAELFLVEKGREQLDKFNIRAEIWHGNFLPPGAERLAKQQADHPSLHHPLPSAYPQHACELSDFALVFAYPWPGEEQFQRDVFLTYAAEGAHLLMFRGPYQIEAYCKQGSDQLRL